jgi:hypothetical protein
MEHPDYRVNLEQVLAYTGGKQCLSIKEVINFTGITDYRTAKRKFPFCGTTITAAALARALCGERIP